MPETQEPIDRLVTTVAAASDRFARAQTLRELAQVALDQFAENGLGGNGGLLCFLGDAFGQRIRVVAASGVYAGIGVAPLAALSDRQAVRLVRSAIKTGRSRFLESFAVLPLQTGGGHSACLLLRLQTALSAWQQSLAQLLAQSMAAAIDRTQLAHRLLRTQHATITTMATLAEYRDVDTGEHVARVARAATEIAQALADGGDMAEIDEAFLEHIGLATILHDIGKIAIPEAILMKPGSLDPGEREIMQRHVTLGRDILLRAARRTDNGELLSKAAEIACHHHERWDGGGYPAGLEGEQIPLAARIVALVDVFDALTSLRPYKAAWPVERALELIRSEAGRHFDPRVVTAFLQLEGARRAACFVEWSDVMSVGHADLDLDHQRLLACINRLWLANSSGNRQVIEFVLDDLVNYTEFHFQREERLMAAAGFPHYEQHCRIHGLICRRLEEIRWEYFQGLHDELRNEILDFLKTWLNKHILEEDMGYRPYLELTAA